VQSFGTELHKGVKDRLTVSTDVKLRERFWRDVESWAKIHLSGTDWQADERILECIKVNALGGTLRQLLVDHQGTRDLSISTVSDLKKWLNEVCTKRSQSTQSEAFDKLQKGVALQRKSGYHDYVAQLERLFVEAKIQDPMHQMKYFRAGLPIEIQAELAVNPATGQEWTDFIELQNKANQLVAAWRAKLSARDFVPNGKGVPRDTPRKNREGLKDPRKGKGKDFRRKRRSDPHPSLAGMQVQEGEEAAPAAKRPRTLPSARGDRRGVKRGNGVKGRKEDDRPPPPRNEKLSPEEVDELRDQRKCFWCFQPLCDCKRGTDGRCRFYGQSRPWKKA